MKTILKVLVGSRAHGLNDEDSDFDFRGVFAVPTTDMLKTFNKEEKNSWIEGEVDNTSYEIGHFLELAQKSNPSILEVLYAPIEEITPLGTELRNLAPKLWNTKDVVASFLGYSNNQRKKMLDDKDERRWKYAVAYVRVLMQGIELLESRTIRYPMADKHLAQLRPIRQGKVSMGYVIEIAEQLVVKLKETADIMAPQFTDKEAVDTFLLKVRKEYWDEVQ